MLKRRWFIILAKILFKSLKVSKERIKMKKYLISENGNFYKANLHCHSTFSDGKFTPEQIKKAYMDKGYSIVAFTDHNVFVPHPELNEEGFLALHGFESDVTEPPREEWPYRKTCHMCFIAYEPDNYLHPFWHRSKYLGKGAIDHRDEVKFDESKPDFERIYTAECISDMVRLGKEGGFFVTYNHPRWSLETYAEYMNYEGIDAMEIYNHGCVVMGYHDYNSVVYDEMLRGGKRIYCLATDDNHTIDRDAFGGFVMIKAEKLEYKAVTDAIKRGDFYASTGPEIKSIWYDTETQTLHVDCSEAKKVIFSTGIRRQGQVLGKPYTTQPEFKLNGNEIYVRVTVIDEEGRTADTNAYFLDELNRI